MIKISGTFDIEKEEENIEVLEIYGDRDAVLIDISALLLHILDELIYSAKPIKGAEEIVKATSHFIKKGMLKVIYKTVLMILENEEGKKN